MKRSRLLRFARMFRALGALAVLGCFDTAFAQPQLIVTPTTSAASPLVFSNVPSGGISTPQTVTVTTANSTSTTIIIQVNPNSPWLLITRGASVNTPASLNVQCNTSGLTTGTYNGSFTVTVSGAPTDQVIVYVRLTVSGSSVLTASPPSLTFTGSEGALSGTPALTSVQISSASGPLQYILQAQTTDGHNWLLLGANTGNTSGAPFTVSVNPSALPQAPSYPAVYNGSIIVFSTSTEDAVQISVQLTLNSVAAVSVSTTTPPPFLWQVGTSDPPAESIAVAATGGSTSFTIQESPVVPWLVLGATSGVAGAAPANISLTAIPKEQNLTAPGTFTTNLVVTPSGQASLPPVPVSLVVASNPVLQITPNALSFSAPIGGPGPTSQTVTVTASGGGAIGFTVSSNQSWLRATPLSGTTPTTLTVQANPTGLAQQTYTGILTLTPTNGDTYTETIAVSFTITASAQMTAGPPGLLFSYEIGQLLPGAQTVALGSNGPSINFTLAVNTSNCGPNWLTATPTALSTNTTLTITVITTGLAAGVCSGNIVLNYNTGSGPANLGIPVTLTVSSSPELSVSMPAGFGVFTESIASAPIQQTISLASTDPAHPVPYIVSFSSTGGPWLGLIGSPTGNTPQSLVVQVTPDAVVSPGVYPGTIAISSPSLTSSFVIPIILTVTSTTTVVVTPGSLSFTENQGGPLPASQSINLASSAGVGTYTAAIASISGGNWLQLSPTSGNTNSNVQVSVLPNNLAPADYPAVISLAFQGTATTAATVNVVLHVLPPQNVSATPTSLSFVYTLGAAAPAAQTLNITSAAGPVNVGVSASSSGWLSVSSTGGTTPQAISVSVNPVGLGAQTYSGSISVSAPGVLSTPLSIPVTLTVASGAAPQPVFIFNNATGVAGAIAAGEELAIKGNNLGPASPSSGVFFTVNPATGKIDPTLAGVEVTFDSIPGTLIYVSANQINVIVPYEINGRISTTMVVSYNGQPSAPDQLSVAAAAPGLFTNNFTGTGQVAALNQNGTYNGASGTGFQAIPRGQVISLYGTGGGQTNPVSFTGTVTPIPANSSQLLYIASTTVTIGGVPAIVTFAGAAPGLVSGVIQVNAIVPAGVTPGSAVPVTVSVGGISSPIGTTIAVQ